MILMLKEALMNGVNLPLVISQAIILMAAVSFLAFRKRTILKRKRRLFRRFQKISMGEIGLIFTVLLVAALALALMILIAFVLPIGWGIALGLAVAAVIAYYFVS